VDRQEGVPGVVGLVEEGLKLGFVELAAEGGKALLEILVHGLAFAGQVDEDADLLPLLVQGVEEGDLPFKALFFLLEGEGALWILPDFGGR